MFQENRISRARYTNRNVRRHTTTHLLPHQPQEGYEYIVVLPENAEQARRQRHRRQREQRRRRQQEEQRRQNRTWDDDHPAIEVISPW